MHGQAAVVIPTRQRVERMVLASGQDPEMVLGTMGLGHGIASIEKVAVAAVMAGCLPDYMPVVVAAVRAVIEPEFDLTEMQATTHCTAPLVLVNGPARQLWAYRLRYWGTGSGASSQRVDRTSPATDHDQYRQGAARFFGHGAAGPSGQVHPVWPRMRKTVRFPPLHVDLGFDPDDSVVTVLGAEAPHSVLYAGDGDDPNGYRVLLDLLAMGLANAPSNNAILTGGAATVVLNPEHSSILHKAGLSRQDIAGELFQRCFLEPDRVKYLMPAFAGENPSRRMAFKDPDQILILQAGGSGLYSMVMPSWCAGTTATAPSA